MSLASKIRGFNSYCKTEKFKKFLGIFTLISLIIYLLISISAYASWFPGSTKYFVFNSTSGLIFRVFSSGLVFAASILTYIAYRDKINRKWLIVFLGIILFSLIGIFFTPTEYYTLYRTTKLYDFMAEYYTSVSIKNIVIMYLSFVVDILFGFCFMFILPKSVSRKSIIIVCSLFLLIILYSCIYSVVFERAYYIKFLSGDWSYSNDTIGSIFGNKQQWGIFLIAAVPASSLMIYFVAKIKLNRIFKVLLVCFYVICILFCLLCGTVSFCKTAIVSFAFFASIFVFGAAIYMLTLKKLIKFFGVFILLGGISLIVFIVLCINIESMHSSGIGKVIYNTYTTLMKSGEGSIDIRLSLVNGFMQNYPGTNFFFGISKGVLDAYVRSLMPELVNGLHTGIIIYYGRTGIIGLVIYAVLLWIIVKKFIKLRKLSPIYCILLFATFGCSIFVNLSELEILILSSSMNAFIFNLLLVTNVCRDTNEIEVIKNEKISFIAI